MKNEYIKEIPGFMKKTTINSKIAQNEPIKLSSTQKSIERYTKLKRDIYSYFCLENEVRRDYFNCNNKNPKGHQNIQQSTTKIVSGDIEPYMQEFQKELDEKGVQLTYSFPLRGKVGFITAKKKIGN